MKFLHFKKQVFAISQKWISFNLFLTYFSRGKQGSSRACVLFFVLQRRDTMRERSSRLYLSHESFDCPTISKEIDP